MGRGSSGGRGDVGKGGGMIAELDLGDDKIDLSKSPLEYGENDKSLTGAARQTVEAFENKRYKNKIEYSQLIKNDGTVVESNKGGKGSVSSSVWAHNQADVLTHNHPRGNGIIGGTFSDADLGNFAKYKQTTYRATAKEGTYSISKSAKFDGDGLTKAYKAYMKQNQAETLKACKQVVADVKSGKIAKADRSKAYAAACNSGLVDLHNWLLKNQKTYGYTYTLERRTQK